MQDQATRAMTLTAIAQGGAPTAPPFTLAVLPMLPREEASTLAAEAPCDPRERPMRPRQRSMPARLARFARTLATHPLATARTCVHAAKMLPTVRQALPRYVLPILVLAAMIKCLPVDFGVDETLFAIAFALVLWRRPGLLKALYREAQAGKPARCQCERHARKAVTT